MKSKPLVSIITSIYNGEKFIDNYLTSILEQTYSKIELILINDGSTDNTESIIFSYQEKLNKEGITLIYKVKTNGGQASAFNIGLKYFSGDFLTWIDCDDYMHPDCIEKKVNYFLEHNEIDYLISKSAYKNIYDKNTVLGYTWNVLPTDRTSMIERILTGKNYYYESGNYMIKSSFFRKVNQTCQIYEDCGTWSGAQIQMMLPVIYYGNYGFLDDCLFDYFLHENNHHNQFKDSKKLKTKYNIAISVYKESIASLKLDEKESLFWENIALQALYHRELASAFRFDDKQWFNTCIKKINKVNIKEIIKFLIIQTSFTLKLFKYFKKKL